jgi:hypothetical protein
VLALAICIGFIAKTLHFVFDHNISGFLSLLSKIVKHHTLLNTYVAHIYCI